MDFRDVPRVSSAPPICEGSPRILLVSPRAERHRQLTEILDGEGYETLATRDSDEVLRLAAEFEPDLVMLDVEQRDITGMEVCGELKASDPSQQLQVVLVAFEETAEQLIAAGLLAGADDFIGDIGRETELRARVRVQLRHRRHLETLQRLRSERDVLKRDAQIDPLTGLMNRRALESNASGRVGARQQFGVLFVDADHFKRINDRWGHLAGDHVLKAIAEVLRASLRPGDIVARYGGEEFVALVAGAGPESARLVAERLRRSVEELEGTPGLPQRVTVSVGTAVFDPRADESSAETVLRQADVALYAAKRTGRNCVIAYAPELETRTSSKPSQMPDRISVAGVGSR